MTQTDGQGVDVNLHHLKTTKVGDSSSLEFVMYFQTSLIAQIGD